MTQIGEQEDDPAEWPDSNHPYVLVSTLYIIARTSFPSDDTLYLVPIITLVH